MSSNITNWIQDHKNRIDPALKRELLKYLSFLKYTPLYIRPHVEKFTHRNIKFPVFIQWKSPYTLTSQQVLLLLQQQKKLQIQQTFPEIGVCLTELSIAQIRELVKTDHVAKLILDRQVSHCLHIATPAIQAPQVWSVDNKGEGATIAILDTGIYPHPDLESRIVAFHDFINEDHQPYDDNGHGTHCAGCMVCIKLQFGGIAIARR